MTGPFADAQATSEQLERLRELARWPGMPPEATVFVEDRIAAGLDVNRAYNMIGQLGRRAYDVAHAVATRAVAPAPEPRRRGRPRPVQEPELL